MIVYKVRVGNAENSLVNVSSIPSFCQTKNERDQFDDLNRRLNMELERVQQQTYSEKSLVKQLQDKLAQADNTERELLTKYNRERDKVAEHCAKITSIENAVTNLEQQNRDYVADIEVHEAHYEEQNLTLARNLEDNDILSAYNICVQSKLCN